ncbi:hypothetical protein [Loktanella sp. M215]|uniref:hypothetical protein n=1 Tax=Loktanella sp. M215 TaxID=2675431 RepID=UPI001F3E78FB|nr:hypothetical protein [Loktanella sp. M215]MCF7700303.1 hypothetical protein [Loktanella sp. M215]
MAVMAIGAGGSAMACPNPDLGAASMITSNGASLRLGQNLRVFAGGAAPLDACSYLGLSRVPKAQFNDAPALVAELGGMQGLALEIGVSSRCATALLVQTEEESWYFNDNGQGPGRPHMLLSRPGNGTLSVWIGTEDGQPCRARLSLTTLLR